MRARLLLLPSATTVVGISWLWAFPAVAQVPTVRGFVADEATFELIPFATLTLVATGEETQSGPDGGFSFDEAPTGPISVRIEAPGYRGVLWETEVIEGRPLFLEVLLSRLEGTGTLSLVVTDAESGGPVAGAEVSLPELGVSAETGQGGEALIQDLPAGRWLVVVSGLGYGSATSFIDFDDETVVDGEVALAEGPVALDGIVVTAERGLARLRDMGFYGRRTVGIGEFIDRAQIDEENPQRPSDLFRTMAGLILIEADVPGKYQISSRRGFTGFGLSTGPGAMQGPRRNAPTCVMDLYVDGVLYPGLIDDLNSDWIEAIEIYNGLSEVPAQYNRMGSVCGVLLVWTRR